MVSRVFERLRVSKKSNKYTHKETTTKQTGAAALHSKTRKIQSTSQPQTPSRHFNIQTQLNDSSSQRPQLNTNFLKRFGRLSCMLKEDVKDELCFIHNHEVIRAYKVYINTYHLWPKWINGILKTCGLGGGYHSAIEIRGKEYHFGGCAKMDSGIFESVPFHTLNDLKKLNITAPEKGDGMEKDLELAAQIGKLKRRTVIGLWAGSKIDIDLFLRYLKEQYDWKGSQYKMLSFNCNHFVKNACEVLLKESKLFYPAKGMTTAEKMATGDLFTLSNCIKRSCCGCLSELLDEDVVGLDYGEAYAFKGKPKTVAAAMPRGDADSRSRNTERSRVYRSTIVGKQGGNSRVPMQRSFPEVPTQQTEALYRRQNSLPVTRVVNHSTSTTSEVIKEVHSELKESCQVKLIEKCVLRQETSGNNAFEVQLRFQEEMTSAEVLSTDPVVSSLKAPSTYGLTKVPSHLDKVGNQRQESNKGNKMVYTNQRFVSGLSRRTHHPLIPAGNKAMKVFATSSSQPHRKARTFSIDDIDQVLYRQRRKRQAEVSPSSSIQSKHHDMKSIASSSSKTFQRTSDFSLTAKG